MQRRCGCCWPMTNVDAVLVISVPPPIEDPTPVAEAIAVAAKDATKPVVVAVMGEATVRPGVESAARFSSDRLSFS